MKRRGQVAAAVAALGLFAAHGALLARVMPDPVPASVGYAVRVVRWDEPTGPVDGSVRVDVDFTGYPGGTYDASIACDDMGGELVGAVDGSLTCEDIDR